MALPRGFDPRSMSFGEVAKTAPTLNIPRNTTYTDSSSNRTLWGRFNGAIASIGNWFADNSDMATGLVSILVTLAIVITALVAVIGVWNNAGWFMAILAAIAAYFIGILAWYIAVIVIVIIVNIFMYALRLIFWNGWSLLLTVAIGIGLWIYLKNTYSSHDYNYTPTQTELVAPPVTEIYVCTARKSLKVRCYPTTNSPQIGSLYNGQEIEVLDIADGFAHFKFNGDDGYASTQYLRKK